MQDKTKKELKLTSVSRKKLRMIIKKMKSSTTLNEEEQKIVKLIMEEK